MVSLKDIAAASGISLTQVSRALNNHSDVSEETKQKVRRIAKEMGYVKNINAQRLATKVSNQIAVIVIGMNEDANDSGGNIFIDIIRGINKFATEVEYEAIIHLVENKRKKSYLEYCKERAIEGVIIIGSQFDDPRFTELVESDFPCVAIDIQIDGKNKGSVIINNTYYSMIAVNEIIKSGKNKIAMLSGTEHDMVSLERKAGYEMALRTNKLTVDENIIINCEFDYNKSIEATRDLLNCNVDGIFCASDYMALGAIKAIEENGLRIPEDIAVFGFDGIPIGQYIRPRLTTIKQDNYKKGYSSAKLLYEILTGKENMGTIVVPCTVEKRESV